MHASIGDGSRQNYVHCRQLYGCSIERNSSSRADGADTLEHSPVNGNVNSHRKTFLSEADMFTQYGDILDESLDLLAVNIHLETDPNISPV